MKKSSIFPMLSVFSLFLCTSALGEPLLFPPDFTWGVSASSYQIEGGNTRSDWVVWEKGNYTDEDGNEKPNIVDGSKIGDAAKHYENYEADFDLIKEMGLKSFHTTIEWSRIEPQRDQWDMAEVAHYRDYFSKLREKGIEPSVSLFHVSLPGWFSSVEGKSTREEVRIPDALRAKFGFGSSGWASEAAIDEFIEYVSFVAEQFGDLVDHWVTMDEPDSYAMRAYRAMPGRSGGDFPPGGNEEADMLLAAVYMLMAHAEAYHAIYANDKENADKDPKGSCADVSLIKSLTQFDASEDPRYRMSKPARDIVDQLFNWSYLDGILGSSTIPKGKINLNTGSKAISVEYPKLANSLDYIAVSYLSRKMIRAKKLGSPEIYDNPDVSPDMKSDRGLEIYPQGLFNLLKTVGDRYRDRDNPKETKEIFVMGNGMADKKDDRRSKYIVGHIKAIADAIKEGVPVKGYYHWTLLHCFEWSQGYAMNYGLFNVDYNDPNRARSWTEGGRTYQSIATLNGISSELQEKYR